MSIQRYDITAETQHDAIVQYPYMLASKSANGQWCRASDVEQLEKELAALKAEPTDDQLEVILTEMYLHDETCAVSISDARDIIKAWRALGGGGA